MCDFAFKVFELKFVFYEKLFVYSTTSFFLFFFSCYLLQN